MVSMSGGWMRGVMRGVIKVDKISLLFQQKNKKKKKKIERFFI